MWLIKDFDIIGIIIIIFIITENYALVKKGWFNKQLNMKHKLPFKMIGGIDVEKESNQARHFCLIKYCFISFFFCNERISINRFLYEKKE